MGRKDDFNLNRILRRYPSIRGTESQVRTQPGMLRLLLIDAMYRQLGRRYRCEEDSTHLSLRNVRFQET